MFLDDELNEIYEREGFAPETSKKLLKVCINRLPSPATTTPKDFLNTLRQIEGSWKLFCKNHTEVNPDGIKNYFCKYIGIDDEIKSFLHW